VSLVLVTGGNGNVGRHLVSALLKRGDEVRVLIADGEDPSWLQERGVAVHPGDIRDPDTLAAPVRDVDAVVHLAGMMGVWRPLEDYRAVNVTGVENVCRAALRAGVSRVVHVSSWTVYGMDLGRPAREEFLLRPMREPYTITKAEGDLAVQRMIVDEHLPAVIIRPGTIFGPDDRLNFGRMADRLRGGRGLIVGSGDNALPLVYVTDVVKGLLLALESERAVGQAYNIGNDLPLTQRQVLDAIAEDIGAPRARLRVPYRVLYAASCVAERVALLTRAENPLVTRHGVRLFGGDNRQAIDKARRELGYRPAVPVRDGIRYAGAWYRSQHHAACPSPQPELLVGSEVRAR
jgi:nucleoside-diphosphate-sugar epimerase